MKGNEIFLEALRKDTEMWDAFTGKNENPNLVSSKYEGNDRQKIMVPAVSEYLTHHGYQVSYPDGKRFAICLTHDVDDIYPPLSHKALSCLYSLISLDIPRLKQDLFWERKGRKSSPYLNFREIMDLERKYGAKSTFYFMTALRDPVRFRYNIGEIKDELREIVKSGWDVGLHGGYYSYDDPQAIQAEKDRLEKALGKEVIGYRNHYLRFKVPDTWAHLEKCGFLFDTTYGYTNTVGFRNGLCHPFRPFNPKTGNQMKIFEIPLHIMDGALFDLTGNYQQAWQITENMIDRAANCSGILTVLWHNSVFNCPFRAKWKKIYEKILEYGQKKNAWMTSSTEIWGWWKEHGY